MNSALDSTGERHASRKTVVKEALTRLQLDLLGVHPSASGIAERQLALLIGALAELGPVFSQFGRYLGTRYDLFRPEACLPLSATGTVRVPTGDELALAHVRHFPDDTADWLRTLKPEVSRADHLVHYYRWPGQGHLSLRLLNSEFVELWPEDQLLLEKLADPAHRIWPHLPFKEAIASYRASVESRCDLGGTAQSYRFFDREPQGPALLGPDSFFLPKIADEFCTPGILTVEEPAPGPHSPTAYAAFNALFRAERTNAARVEVARSLCLIWLRQAVRGSWFPEEVSARHLGLDQDGAICVLGGALAPADAESQEFLFRYLCAVGANQPDIAADILVTHLHPGRRAKGLEEVRDLFRQIVPYRDGQINTSGDHELFAEHVLAQFRIIREAGYELDPGLIAFQSSLGSLGRLVHQLSPRRDAFKDALYEFRWSDSLSNLRNLFTFGTVAKQSQEWLNLIMEIPEKMNLAAQGRGMAQSTPVPEAKRPATSASPSLVFFGHAFLILVLGWLLHNLLAYREGSEFLVTVAAISIIGTGVSMIRSLLIHR